MIVGSIYRSFMSCFPPQNIYPPWFLGSNISIKRLVWNSVIIREYSVASFVLLENYYAIVFLSLSMKSLYSSSWINTKSGATQVYPQFAYLKVHIFKAALLRSAPLSIIVGHFPPNSKIQGIRFSAAALAIYFPFLVSR